MPCKVEMVLLFCRHYHAACRHLSRGDTSQIYEESPGPYQGRKWYGGPNGTAGRTMGSANVYNELYAMQSPWLLLNVIHQLHLDMSYTIKGIRNKDLYAETQPVIVDFKDITEEDDVRMKIDLNKNGNVRVYKFKKNDDTFDDDLTGKVGQTFKTSIGNVEIKATPYLSKMEDDEVTITVNRIEPMALVDHIKKKRLNIVVGSRKKETGRWLCRSNTSLSVSPRSRQN